MAKRIKYYRTSDVADIYGCSTKDVWRAIQEGVLNAFKRSGKLYIRMDQTESFEAFKEWLKTIPKAEKPAEVPAKPAVVKKARGTRYLADKEIIDALLPEIKGAKKSIKIATSNFKNLYVNKRSIFDLFEKKVKEGVKIQIICMDINPAAQEELDKHVFLKENKKLFKMKVCSRSHMKMMAFDYSLVYIGSANLTNTAIGSKADSQKNYENGIITDSEQLVIQAIGHFDKVWVKSACEGCESKICGNNQ